MQDLSALAKDSMWATSQEAGNMTSDRPAAMSAPGSPPVTPLPAAKDQGSPEVSFSGPKIEPGSNGRPSPRNSMPASRPGWVRTSTAQEAPDA